MDHEALFATEENRRLMVVCARRTIRDAGMGGVAWGCLNIVLGILVLSANPINVGLILLGALILGAGVNALSAPSLGSLFVEGVVSLLLLAWNIGIAILNAQAGIASRPGSVVLPIVAAVLFFRLHRRLDHLREAIGAMDPGVVRQAAKDLGALFKKKLKVSPDLAEATSKRCRVQAGDGSILVVQRDLRRAFRLRLDDFTKALSDPQAAKLKLAIEHPLGKLKYAFDKKNSAKIKGWLAPAVVPVPVPVRAR